MWARVQHLSDIMQLRKIAAIFQQRQLMVRHIKESQLLPKIMLICSRDNQAQCALFLLSRLRYAFLDRHLATQKTILTQMDAILERENTIAM